MLQMQTCARVDEIGGWYRLRIIYMNGTGDIEPFVVFVYHVTGTIGGAQATGRALVGVNIPGSDVEFRLEITRFAVQRKKIGIGKNFDIGRPTGLYQFWRQDSEGTVIGGKGFVELCHTAAHRRRTLDKIHVKAETGKVICSLQTGNPAT